MTIPIQTAVDQLTKAGVGVVISSQDQLTADTDGFYERFGSNESPFVGFAITDWGDNVVSIIVKCPQKFGGKTEQYNLSQFQQGIDRIIEIFG